MATRNLTEIYINLRTEISRFKAYSLGDSGVRSDSPGVLYIYATKTYTVITRDKKTRTTDSDGDFFCLDWNRTMIQLPLLEERVISNLEYKPGGLGLYLHNGGYIFVLFSGETYC